MYVPHLCVVAKDIHLSQPLNMKSPSKLKDNWEISKAEYTHRMDEFDKEFTGFTNTIIIK